MAIYGPLLITIDRLLLGICVVELVARMTVFRSAFWRDPWSLQETSDAVSIGRARRA